MLEEVRGKSGLVLAHDHRDVPTSQIDGELLLPRATNILPTFRTSRNYVEGATFREPLITRLPGKRTSMMRLSTPFPVNAKNRTISVQRLSDNGNANEPSSTTSPCVTPDARATLHAWKVEEGEVHHFRQSL